MKRMLLNIFFQPSFTVRNISFKRRYKNLSYLFFTNFLRNIFSQHSAKHFFKHLANIFLKHLAKKQILILALQNYEKTSLKRL